MDSTPVDDTPDSIVQARVGEAPGRGDALFFNAGQGPQQIYGEYEQNRTPKQCGRILKLRALLGNRITFADRDGRRRAYVAFEEDGGATLTWYAEDGVEVWSGPVRLEDCIPDAPAPDPETRPMYRWLAVAFGLFLFVLLDIGLLAYWFPRFAVGAVFAGFAVIFASIAVLIVVRRRMGL